MGIPTFFQSILKQNLSVLSTRAPVRVDYFFVDFNSVIYAAWSRVSRTVHTQDTVQDILIACVIDQIQHMIHMVKPTVYTYISLDGTAPRAKMVQQRSRRYKSVQLKELTSTGASMFDPSPNIAPGTLFMERLGMALKNLMRSGRIGSVLLSDSCTPGEGEHKFLPRIRNLARRAATQDDPVVIYSPDGDMISLALLTHKKNVFIMRVPDPLSEYERRFCDTGKYIFCDLNMVRADFYRELVRTYNGSSKINELKILMDYNFLLSMVGNDFVPSLHFMKIRSGGLRLLIDIYVQLRARYKDEDDYLVIYDAMADGVPTINMKFFRDLVREISHREARELRRTQAVIVRERLGHLSERTMAAECGMTPQQIYRSRLEHVPLCNPCNPLYEQYKSDFRTVDFTDVRWKDAYYEHFGIASDDDDDAERTKMVINYFESLMFTLQYYVTTCPSWTWHYRYRVSPIPSDMYRVLTKTRFDLNTIRFQMGEPFTPFEQLMHILPPQMTHLLPLSLQSVMSAFPQYYPQSFRVDALAGLKYIYSEAILPEFDSDVVLAAVRRIEGSGELSVSERRRNAIRRKIFAHRV